MKEQLSSGLRRLEEQCTGVEGEIVTDGNIDC